MPKYQSLRATATSHQFEAAKLMKEGEFRRAAELLDKAIALLSTVPTQHRCATVTAVLASYGAARHSSAMW